jgi:hypothetical protein
LTEKMKELTEDRVREIIREEIRLLSQDWEPQGMQMFGYSIPSAESKEIRAPQESDSSAPLRP